MMSKKDDVEAVSGAHQHHYPPPPPPPPPQQYPPTPQKGTFQVVSNNSPAPQLVQPPPGNQTYPPGYAVAGGMSVREPPLPCGIGYGWILFILGFLFGIIPWYIGAIILMCSRIDPREKPGCIACQLLQAVVAKIIVVVVIATNAAHHQ